MATCEHCGATFEQPSGPVEVTSTRVLCPACESVRRAEKAARVAGRQQAQASHGSDRLPPASPARRLGGVHRTAPAQAAPVPASTPRPRASAPPRANAAQASAANVDGEARAQPARVRARPGAPQPASAKPARGKREQHSDDVERGKKLLRQQESRITVVGWAVAFLLTGAAGTALYLVKQKKDQQTAAEEARRQQVNDFFEDLKALDITTDEGARAAILLIDDNPDVWKDEPIDADVTSKRAKAQLNLGISHDRTLLRGRLDAILSALEDPESLSAEYLAKQRREIDSLELDGKLDLLGGENIARLGAAKASATRVYAAKTLEEAKAAAKGDPAKGREALAKLSIAEEEIQRIFDKSIKANDKEAKDYYEGLYREAIKTSDALCAQVFTPEEIARAPWIDLLSGDWVQKWKRAEVKGFNHRIENGVLHATGPDADTGAKGVLAIGQGEKWRDFVLDLEFTLAKGSLDLNFRVSQQPDVTTEAFEIATDGEDAVLAGEVYNAEISLIGSQLVYREQDAVDVSPYTKELSWTKSRWGALCLVIPDGTELKLSRLRIRVLR